MQCTALGEWRNCLEKVVKTCILPQYSPDFRWWELGEGWDIFVVFGLQIGSPQINPFPPELKLLMENLETFLDFRFNHVKLHIPHFGTSPWEVTFDIVETSLCTGRLQSCSVCNPGFTTNVTEVFRLSQISEFFVLIWLQMNLQDAGRSSCLQHAQYHPGEYWKEFN